MCACEHARTHKIYFGKGVGLYSKLCVYFCHSTIMLLRGPGVALLVQLLLFGMMTTRGEEEVAADGAISARWFFQQGVAMQVQDTTGPEPCLRSFRVIFLL